MPSTVKLRMTQVFVSNAKSTPISTEVIIVYLEADLKILAEILTAYYSKNWLMVCKTILLIVSNVLLDT